jgi:signal transduction histidine kinase
MNPSKIGESAGDTSIDVLLIEDSQIDIAILRHLLSKERDAFVIHTAGTMRAAIERLSEGGIQLVLTDLTLPDSQDFETLAAVQAAAPRIPIIVLSGLSDEEIAVRMVEMGAEDYLVKGRIDRHSLVRAMRYAIERNRMKRELESAHDELEQRVQDRTAALARTTEQLQATVDQLQRTQEQMVRQERLSALGRMASGIAHDFNNALSPIVALSEQLLDPRPVVQAKLQEYLKLIHLAAKDSTEVVRRLREFYRYRDEHDVFTPVAVNDLIRHVELLTKPRWKTQAFGRGAYIQFVTELQSVPAVNGNESELRELLTNLVFNAVDAIPEHGTITVRTFCRGDAVMLQISDTGAGMTDDVRMHCLEPFYTTKHEHGTGLGLAMVAGIVRRHGGEIEIETAPRKGTTITISLVADTAVRVPEPIKPAAKPSGALAILAVDDEELIREVLMVVLSEDGHAVETAANGAEGLQKLTVRPFDVIITDRAMPHMNGDQFATAVRGLYPDIPVILLTGFGDLMTAVGDHPSVFDVVASKPFTANSLRTAIAEALAHHAPEATAPAVRHGVSIQVS